MDFDPAQYMKILAAVLLIPGLLFLFVVVFYVAFIGRASTAKAATREAGRTCLKCGQALLPDQNECPTCVPQLIQSVAPEVESEITLEEEMEWAAEAEEPPAAPIDYGTAYEGEIMDDREPPPNS
jgi:hypothetical protein